MKSLAETLSIPLIMASFLLPQKSFSQEKLSKEFVADLNGDGIPEKSCVYRENKKPALKIIDGTNPSGNKTYSSFPLFEGLYLKEGSQGNYLIYLFEKSDSKAMGFRISYDRFNGDYRTDTRKFTKEENPEFFE